MNPSEEHLDTLMREINAGKHNAEIDDIRAQIESLRKELRSDSVAILISLIQLNNRTESIEAKASALELMMNNEKK